MNNFLNTLNGLNLKNTVAFVLGLTLALLVGLAGAAEPRTAVSAHNDVPTNHTDNTIQQTGFNAYFSQDDGIPLAREDVIPLQTAVSGSSGTSTMDDAQQKISGRATNAQMQSFLTRTSMNQILSVYREAAQMIDMRHVNPPSYEVRSQGAVQSVMLALNNPEFLRVNNASMNNGSIQNIQMQLQQMAQTQVARDVNQAMALMQSVAEVVNRGTGIRREAVALEFLNGTMDVLDKYSAFMPESGNGRPGAMLDTVLTAGLEENIVGVGVELKGHAQGVEIVGVVDNSPAAELGLREGDIIVGINNQSMAGRTLNEVADRIAGTAGSSVAVEILRNGQKFQGTMVRRKVYVSSVSGTKMLDQSGTGYIRLKQFSESSATDLEKALWSLHNQGMKNLVLDLRGNPGGLLDVCVTISDMFLTKGTIVSTRGRNASDNTQEVATFPKTWAVPLVVLVDDNSASASEIFAAAMQENQRGIIVGRTSYGKGTVQTHFPMTATNAILKLTTAKFYSPNGREMAGAGVTPDVPVNVETSASRGSASDADIQTAGMLISQNAPGMLLAGNLNLNQLRTAPVNNVPNYNTYPTFNGAPNFNTPPTYSPVTTPDFHNGNWNLGNNNGGNWNNGTTPDFNLSNNWNVNGTPNFNGMNRGRGPGGRPANLPNNYPTYNAAPNDNAAPGYGVPGLFAPQANQVPAGMKEL